MEGEYSLCGRVGLLRDDILVVTVQVTKPGGGGGDVFDGGNPGTQQALKGVDDISWSEVVMYN